MSQVPLRSTRTKCLIVIPDSPCSRRISTNNTRTSRCLCLLTTLYGLPALQFYFLLVLLFLALSSPCHALLPLPCNLYGKAYYFITHPLKPQEQSTGQPESGRWVYWPERHTHRRTAENDEKNCNLNSICVWQF